MCFSSASLSAFIASGVIGMAWDTRGYGLSNSSSCQARLISGANPRAFAQASSQAILAPCDTIGLMPKRSSKAPQDVNVLAADIVAEATGDSDKNPHAVALGRMGGKKGGPARAKKLSKKRRSEIARVAAQARWMR